MTKVIRHITVLFIAISLLFLISSCSSTNPNNTNITPDSDSQPSAEQVEEMKKKAFLSVIDSMFSNAEPTSDAQTSALEWMITDMKDRLVRQKAYKNDQSKWRDIIQEEMYIQTIRSSTLTKEPSVYIGDAFDFFFTHPIWETFLGTRANSDEEVRIVEFRGECLENDKSVSALIQFELDDDWNFDYSYFSIDDRGRSLLELQALTEKAVETYKIESNKATPAN